MSIGLTRVSPSPSAKVVSPKSESQRIPGADHIILTVLPCCLLGMCLCTSGTSSVSTLGYLVSDQQLILPTYAISGGKWSKRRPRVRTITRHILPVLTSLNHFRFPFLYIGIYLILRQTPSHPVHTVGGAIGEWYVDMSCEMSWRSLDFHIRVYNVLLYEILLSVVIGAAIG